MPPRGRKPVPDAIKDIKGNPGKRTRKKGVAAPEGIPECPEHLNDAAKREWFRIVPELHVLGVLSTIDRAALAGYCVNYARWEEAEEMIPKTGGLVVQAPKSGYPMQNPYLSISNAAQKEMHKFLVEFGMTPSSRTRVGTGNAPHAPEDPADAFFGPPKSRAPRGPRLA